MRVIRIDVAKIAQEYEGEQLLESIGMGRRKYRWLSEDDEDAREKDEAAITDFLRERIQ